MNRISLSLHYIFTEKLSESDLNPNIISKCFFEIGQMPAGTIGHKSGIHPLLLITRDTQLRCLSFRTEVFSGENKAFIFPSPNRISANGTPYPGRHQAITSPIHHLTSSAASTPESTQVDRLASRTHSLKLLSEHGAVWPDPNHIPYHILVLMTSCALSVALVYRSTLGGLLSSSYRQHQESLAAERERRRQEREERLQRIEREERNRFKLVSLY